jgi:electron transfer flavoprotein beta subunit
MKIVVLVKHVASPVAGARLDEADEYPVEQARRIARRERPAQITALTFGPARAVRALRRALVLGADEGVHVLTGDSGAEEPTDDPMVVARVLAAATARLGFDLVLCGAGCAGAAMSVIPAMVAEYLGVPVFCQADALDVRDREAEVRRDEGLGPQMCRIGLPAVVSVTERCGEAAYPTFGALADARRKLLRTWPLSRLDLDPADLRPATVRVLAGAATRPRGQLVDGDAAAAAVRLVDFLAGRELL